MSQKFAKKESAHPTTFDKTFNGSIVVSFGEGRSDKFTENKVVVHPSINRPIIASTRPVSIPAGSGVYLA